MTTPKSNLIVLSDLVNEPIDTLHILPYGDNKLENLLRSPMATTGKEQIKSVLRSNCLFDSDTSSFFIFYYNDKK